MCEDKFSELDELERIAATRHSDILKTSGSLKLEKLIYIYTYKIKFSVYYAIFEKNYTGCSKKVAITENAL